MASTEGETMYEAIESRIPSSWCGQPIRPWLVRDPGGHLIASFDGPDREADAKLFADAKNLQADAEAAGPMAIRNNMGMLARALTPQ